MSHVAFREKRFPNPGLVNSCQVKVARFSARAIALEGLQVWI